MVGSYPRPHWYTQQLLGRDVRVAFKEVRHEEAYHDATQVVIRDQEEAGLDVVTDGQMSYDDYVGVIGSFCWYMYERIGGFDPAREEHPSVTAESDDNTVNALLTDWGGVINSAARSPTARSGSSTCTRSPSSTRTSRSRSRSAPGRSTWPGTSTSSTTRIRRSSATRSRRSSTPR